MNNITAIEKHILLIRGQKILLDTALAELYGVKTKVLLQAVKRNIGRFPDGFMFQLADNEREYLRSQIVTSKGRGGRRTLPYAFTEQGVAMLSSVLRSSQAVQVNIEIMRAFVKLRQILMENTELTSRLNQLEQRYDKQFKVIFDVIREPMKPPEPKHKSIGFIWDNNQPKSEKGK